MAPNFWGFSVATLLLFYFADAKEPSMKWAQDKDNLFLTISVDCASNKVFKPTADRFELSCNRKGGAKYDLSFNLREFIKPSESSCKTIRGEEECKLVKQHPHFLDRLTRDADEFKQNLKPDWSRWKDEAEPEGSQSDDNYEGSVDVKPMKLSEIDAALKNGAVVVADIFFPWCTHCTYIRKAFVGAAKALASEKQIFARVDAREEHDAAHRYNISCDYKCNFHVLQNDEPAALVASKANEAELIKTLKPYFLPAITTLSSEDELTKFKAANPISALALLKGGFMSKAVDSGEYKALQKAAQSVRGKVAVAFSEKSLGGFNPPAIKVFGNTSEPRDVAISKNETELARQLVLESLPFLDEYSWQKRDVYDGIGLPIVHAFIDEKSPSANADAELVQSVAKQFRGKLSFVQMKKSDDYLLKDFGLPEKLPAIGIALNFSYNSPKYGYEGELDEVGIASFCKSFLAGELKPSFKSEPIPPEDGKPGVRKVVWKTLSNVLGGTDSSGSKYTTLLLVYKPWSQDREKAQGIFDKVAEALEDVPNFRLGAIDSSKNHLDAAVFGGLAAEESKVSIFLCRGDGSRPELYTGTVSQKEILKFVAKKVEEVKANWEGSIKGKLKKMKEAEAEKKREAAAKEAAEAERKAEEVKKIEELIASAEKEDVGIKKDGGIIKQVVTAGEGAFPSKGDKVTAHYTGTLLDGTKFDSSRDRGDPFTFTLGQGQVIACWDQSFATMKKGERAILTCNSDYAYGDRGSPPKIPSKATLRFDVELVSFARDEL